MGATRRIRTSRPSTWLAMGVLVALVCPGGVASAAVTPVKRTVTVRAGEKATARFTVDPTPPIDVALVFDTTGSLGENLKEAQEEAARIVEDIQSYVPDAHFAVAQFKDKGDKPEYRVEQKLTAGAAAVSAAVGRLTSRGGGDLPEAYNLVFHNSFIPATGGPLGWRTSSRKFVVVVGDAEPHGAGTAGIDGCKDTSADPHGLNTAAVLSDLAAAGRTLVMVHLMNHHAMVMGQIPASLECYQGLAEVAGGVAVEGHHEELGHSIVHAVTGQVPAADQDAALGLKVVRASPSPASKGWVTVFHAAANPREDHQHQVDVKVSVRPPRKTKPGTYRFEFVALANGVNVGRAVVLVKVLGP